MAQSALREATVTIAFVNPPKGDAKTGSIKAKDGTIYRVKPELLDVFQAGGTYEIEYEPREFPPGNFQNYLQTARDANGASVTPQRRAIPEPKPTQQANTNRQNDGGLDITLCGLVKSFIEAGKVDLNPASIAKARKICKAGWLDEMNDEIGF